MVETEKVEKLYSAVRKGWSRETAADPENWDDENPAYSQCAVTAAVVQDYLGGTIEWIEVEVSGVEGYEDYFEEDEKVSHYFNKVGDRRLDLTMEQFPEGYIGKQDREKLEGKLENHDCLRDYVLSYEETEKRYQELKSRVEFHLSDL